MCFDGSGTVLRQPLGSASQAQPNGPRAPIHVRHREREVGRREPVEHELPALRQQLPEPSLQALRAPQPGHFGFCR